MINMKQLGLVFLMIYATLYLGAQPQLIATHTYPNHNNAEIRGGFQMAENQYFWGGVVNSSQERSDAILLQTDENGKETDVETFAKGQQEEMRAMVKLADGGVAFVGTSQFYNEEEARIEGSIWLLRLDKDKHVIVNKKWEVFDVLDEGTYLTTSPDGGFLIVGNIRSRGQGKSDIWVVKTDAQGNMIWEKTFGGKEDDIATCVSSVKNGYVITSYITTPQKKKKFRVMMCSQDGFVFWDKSDTEVNESQANFVLAQKDGSVIVLGTEDIGNGNEDAIVLKFNTKGKLLWKQKYGGTRKDIFYTAIEVKDGFLLGGSTFSNRNEWGWGDMWLMKIGKNGEKDWSNTYGEGNLQEAIKAICLTPKQEILLGGEQFKEARHKQMIIVKVK